MPDAVERGCWGRQAGQYGFEVARTGEGPGKNRELHGRTKFPSRVARRSTGRNMKKKTRLSTANPLAARVCEMDNDDGRLEADRFRLHNRAKGRLGQGEGLLTTTP